MNGGLSNMGNATINSARNSFSANSQSTLLNSPPGFNIKHPSLKGLFPGAEEGGQSDILGLLKQFSYGRKSSDDANGNLLQFLSAGMASRQENKVNMIWEYNTTLYINHKYQPHDIKNLSTLYSINTLNSTSLLLIYL